MVCSTPSTRPHFSATAARTASRCSGTVTSSSKTSTGVESLRAVRWVRWAPRPAPVEHDVGALALGRAATPYAREASVRTPVMTMFLPSSETHARERNPPPAPASGHRPRRVQGSPNAHRHPWRRRPRGRARSLPDRLDRLRRGHRLTVEVSGDGGSRRADRALADLLAPRLRRQPGRGRLRPGGHRHAVGFGGHHRPGAGRGALDGKIVVSMANALVRVGRSSSRSCRRAAVWPHTCRRRCPAARSWRPSTTCRPTSWVASASRSTATC